MSFRIKQSLCYLCHNEASVFIFHWHLFWHIVCVSPIVLLSRNTWSWEMHKEKKFNWLMVLWLYQKHNGIWSVSAEGLRSLQLWYKVKGEPTSHTAGEEARVRRERSQTLLNNQISHKLTKQALPHHQWDSAKPFTGDPSPWSSHQTPPPTLGILFQCEIWRWQRSKPYQSSIFLLPIFQISCLWDCLPLRTTKKIDNPLWIWLLGPRL